MSKWWKCFKSPKNGDFLFDILKINNLNISSPGIKKIRTIFSALTIFSWFKPELYKYIVRSPINEPKSEDPELPRKYSPL